jgi:tRNA (guanine37-N1)-methyltransferase
MSPAVPEFDVITLFPDMFQAFSQSGVVGRGFKSGKAVLRLWNPRDFATDAYKTIDDRPYGGGPGMVMMAPPLASCIQAIRLAHGPDRPVVFLTPHGPLLKQAHVRQLASTSGAILLCGRYEGVDQRFIDAYVDQTFCIGDFVVSGGELPTQMLMDAWVRLLPGVLNDALSAQQDSFTSDRLDCPHYTRPEVFEGKSVPEVLLSGNHGKIEGWRLQMSTEFTRALRPDLFKQSES